MAKLGSSDILLSLTDKQIESLSRSELAPIVTRLNDIANRRIGRMEKQSDLHSPAVEYIKRTGGFEGVRGKDLEEIRAQYMRVRKFLGAQTATVKGAKEYKKEMFEKAAKSIGITSAELEQNMSETQKRRFWKVLDRAAEAGIISKSGEEFYRARQALAQEIDSGDKRRGVDTLFNEVFGEGGRLQTMYEEEQAGLPSGYFE